MKKIYGLFIFVFLFFIFQNVISADTYHYSSDYIDIDYIFHNKDNFVYFKDIVLHKGIKNSKPTASLQGKMWGLLHSGITYEITVHYYDKDYNIVATSKSTEIPNDIDSGEAYYIDIELKEQDFLENKSLDDIKYYTLHYHLDDEIYARNSDKESKFKITNYDIDVKVNENNVFDVTEKITVKNFLSFNRFISSERKYINDDGLLSDQKTGISNVKVNYPFEVSNINYNYIIRIESDKETDEITYIISYSYHNGKDPLKSKDLIMYELTDNSWHTPIETIHFKVSLPKAFDKNKISFLNSSRNVIHNDFIDYSVDGNVIVGTYKDLMPLKEIYVSIDLPDGYFISSIMRDNLFEYLIFIIPLISFIGSILLMNTKIFSKKITLFFLFCINIISLVCYPLYRYHQLETPFLIIIINGFICILLFLYGLKMLYSIHIKSKIIGYHIFIYFYFIWSFHSIYKSLFFDSLYTFGFIFTILSMLIIDICSLLEKNLRIR